LSIEGRRRLVARCPTRPIAHVAAEIGISRACASKWINRWRRFGEAGLHDRSSAPHLSPTAIQDDDSVETVLEGPLMRYGAGSPSTRDHVRALLRTCQETGYSKSEEEVTPGTLGLSVPVLDPDGVSRAVCVTTDANSITVDRERVLIAELRHPVSTLARAVTEPAENGD
jgi:hypothetical protein